MTLSFIVSFDMLNEFAIFKSNLTYNAINFDKNIFEQIPHNRSHKYNNTYVVIIFSNNCLVSALFFVSQNLREFIHPIYSCKEKERCGRGNCDLKRNVTNLLSWNILLKKKNILNHPHQLFKLSLYFSNFIFERRSLSLQIFNFNNILFSFWLFSRMSW